MVAFYKSGNVQTIKQWMNYVIYTWVIFWMMTCLLPGDRVLGLHWLWKTSTIAYRPFR